MALPTYQQVHPVDPVLTNLLIGYMQADDRFIALRFAPALPADTSTGTYFIFTKKYWFLDEMKKRAPGAEFARAGVGVSSTTFSTEQFALENVIPTEIQNASQVPLSLETAGTKWLAGQSLIRKERAFATDFLTTGVWGTDMVGAASGNGTSTLTYWSDFSLGDPVKDVLAARKTVSDNTGQNANTLALALAVHNALVNHPDVIDRVKYTMQANQANIESALAALFGVENYWIGRASYNTANEGQSFSGSEIWGTNALIGHVTPGPGILMPSAAYTFFWVGGGGLGQIAAYYDFHIKSDILQHTEQWDQVAVATDLGYYFSAIVQ